MRKPVACVPKKISPSLEDYLEAIYHLGEEQPKVRVTDIAARLGIAKPSVNKAIGILSERGLINHERYGLAELTEAGRLAARSVIEKHSALMEFLISVLGVDPETAGQEACKIEHVISDSTLRKMIDFTGKYMG